MSIIGLQELEKHLERIGSADFTRAMKLSTLQVKSTARNYCPVDRGELKQSIFSTVESGAGYTRGIVFTNKEYAPYVEFGTGLVGQAFHEGISPEVNPSYTQGGWWIHESMVDPSVPEKYHWRKIITDDGIFYYTEGQPAQPFMYPAIKDNEEIIVEIFDDVIEGII